MKQSPSETETSPPNFSVNSLGGGVRFIFIHLEVDDIHQHIQEHSIVALCTNKVIAARAVVVAVLKVVEDGPLVVASFASLP